MRRLLAKATDLSRAQITRLVRQYRTTGAIADRRGAPRRPFPRRYTGADIGLLAETDLLHGTLFGPATRKLCGRVWHCFGDERFERLAAISNGHLYNLRQSVSYRRRRGALPAPTRSVQVAMGERRRPQPFGQPGWVRFDTVHQGELDGIKGRNCRVSSATAPTAPPTSSTGAASATAWRSRRTEGAAVAMLASVLTGFGCACIHPRRHRR